MRITSIAALGALLTLGIHGFAQAPVVPAPSAIQVPDGDGAWTLTITTGGGFTGRGRGNATLTSQGFLSGNKLAADKAESVTRLVASFDLAKWSAVSPGSAQQPSIGCNDCFTTTVLLVRREEGQLKTRSLSWNDVSQSTVPPEVLKIVEMALAGK